MCGSVCVYVYVCVCIIVLYVCVCVQAKDIRERRAYKEKEMKLNVEEKAVSREDRGRGSNETAREKYEAMDYNKSKFLWYNTAPFCSCTEQHLLSLSCGNV